MDLYEYKGKNLSGGRKTGTVQAFDEDEAWRAVRLLGYYPVRLKKKSPRLHRRPLRAAYLSAFCGNLSAMLSSGVPILKAIDVIGEKETGKQQKFVLRELSLMLLQGSDLTSAMEAAGGAFPPLIVAMVRAGEDGGCLAGIVSVMEGYYKKEEELRRKVVTALVYPGFLAVMVMASLIFLFTAILPEFFPVFESMESIPWITRFLMAFGGGEDIAVWFFAGSIMAAAIMAYGAHIPSVRRIVSKLIFRLPFAGRLASAVYTARFARTFGISYQNGIPVEHALFLAAGVIGNRYLNKCVLTAADAMANGMLLSEAFLGIREFDQELVGSFYIGEESGDLALVLGRVTDSFEKRADMALDRFLSILEPSMILIMAVVIGGLLMAVMIPIYQYYRTIG